MAISPLPVAYCANVHAGATWDEAKSNLQQIAPAVQSRLGRRIGVGGWLSADACQNLIQSSSQWDAFAAWLAESSLSIYTMNAFPFGNFHAHRVKKNVYRPDWTSAERCRYTCAVADLLARLLPEDGEGSISTLPLAFAPHHPMSKDLSIYRERLVEVARHLARLAEQTGRVIRLAIEPEPGCVLETTPQVVQYFESLWRATDSTPDESAVRTHIGLCYDVCHQAVEYEDIDWSIQEIDRAAVRINKVQLSCAIELRDPLDEGARQELAGFAEERYLHQTFAQHRSGRLLKLLDLTESHATDPTADWLDCSSWRVHFHVPVHLDTIGRLATTRPVLLEAIESIRKLEYAPHLEVETYTWGVLAGSTAGTPVDLVEGLARELASVQECIDSPPEPV